MILHNRTIGNGEPMVILHGLLGSLDNWQTLAKRWSTYFKVISIDLRNHGRSPHHHDMHYQVMAGDIIETITSLGLTQINLVGHSMGGKVAMACALMANARFRTLTILDIAPKTYPNHHLAILEAMDKLDISIGSRSQMDNVLTRSIKSRAIRQLILKNLTKNQEREGFDWKINLQGIKQNLAVLSSWPGAEHWSEVNNSSKIKMTYFGPSQFIFGSKSNYVVEEDKALIQSYFPNSAFKTIDGGHWLHAEKPDEIYQSIIDFIR